MADTPHAIFDGLRALVEREDMQVESLHVSLLVSGTWISGIVVNAERYTRVVLDGMAEGAQDPATRAFIEEVRSGEDLSPAVDDPRVLLLVDCVSLLPDGSRLEGSTLSVKLDSVDAFTLGRMEPS